MVVSEAGASVYSASKLAAEEFPKYDVSKHLLFFQIYAPDQFDRVLYVFGCKKNECSQHNDSY